MALSLDFHAFRLKQYLRLSCKAPAWQSERFVMSADVRRRASAQVWGGTMEAPADALKTPPEFAPVFDALLDKGYAWVNLAAAGVLDGTLIVVVELPAKPGRVPRDRVAVNLSGPALRGAEPQWDLAGRLKLTT